MSQSKSESKTGLFSFVQRFWRDDDILYVIGGLVIGLLIYPALTSIVDIATFLENLVPEAVGILFTVFFIDRLNQRREEIRRIQDIQERLIREAGSASNETAKAAISDLNKRGWLGGGDGLLEGKALHYADLKGANLYYANLRGTDLRGADLHGADLIGADMRDADLKGANLRDAILMYRDKRTGEERKANMTHAKYDARTVMPDGNHWHEGIDWAQFGAITDDPELMPEEPH